MSYNTAYAGALRLRVLPGAGRRGRQAPHRGDGISAYDFTRQIAGERAEVTLLVPPGSESHSYEPTPQDMLLLKDCALLVANGGESEAWLDSVADGLDGNVPILRMLDCVTALEEETREGCSPVAY